MATQFWRIYQATLFLTVSLGGRAANTGFSVDPPDDVRIRDPGFLGYLEISWSPPSSLTNATECPKLYQLEYFNSYSGSWSTVRTPMRSYSAQFDLMKDVRVRVYTLLSGPCTKGTTIKSTNYTELVHKPPSTAANTEVKDFVCVNHNMESVECTWQRGAKTPDNAQQHLYFWHNELEHAEECPNYITSGGVRRGCKFTDPPLPLFTDVNLCVNGSSPDGPLKPKFVSLQIQNHIKPATAEKLYVHAGPDRLEVTWEHPAGNVPGHCLEWEVERHLHGPAGKKTLELTSTTETKLSMPSIDQKDNICFRIRSKLQTYCVEKGLWSDWSRPVCLREKPELMSGPEGDRGAVYVYVAVAIIATVMLCLCVGSAAFKILSQPSRPRKHVSGKINMTHG